MKRKDESVGINARDTHGVPGAGCVLMEYGFEQVDLSSALSPNTVCTLCTLLMMTSGCLAMKMMDRWMGFLEPRSTMVTLSLSYTHTHTWQETSVQCLCVRG